MLIYFVDNLLNIFEFKGSNNIQTFRNIMVLFAKMSDTLYILVCDFYCFSSIIK